MAGLANEGRVDIRVRMSNDEIRQEVLLFTPVGSSEKDVVTFIDKRMGYRNNHINFDRLNPALKNRWDVEHESERAVGEWNIEINSGSYGWNPLNRMFVYIQWAFGADNKLEDVVVSRCADAL